MLPWTNDDVWKKISGNGMRKKKSLTAKKGKYYLPVGAIAGRDAIAVLSQIRFVDRKRLAMKIGTLDQNIFLSLTKAVVKACFPAL